MSLSEQVEEREQEENAGEVSLFERSPEMEGSEQNLRIQIYKAYLLEHTDDDLVTDHYPPLGGEGEYSDYNCSEHCGCDQIPSQDDCVVNRHHFHYRNDQNGIQWCCLITDIASEKILPKFVALGRCIDEMNWMLERTYFRPESIADVIAMAMPEFTPVSFQPKQFSLQLQSLVLAREYLRQVLSTLKLPTYHYKQFLYLQNCLVNRLGTPAALAKFVLPGLKEPRFVSLPSAIPYFPYYKSAKSTIVFGIREFLGGLPPRFVYNGVFQSKFELWQLLFELSVYNREPKTDVGLNYIHRLYSYLRQLDSDTEAIYQEEDFIEAKRLAYIAYCETKQVGNITTLLN